MDMIRFAVDLSQVLHQSHLRPWQRSPAWSRKWDFSDITGSTCCRCSAGDARRKDRALRQQGRQAARGEMIGNIAPLWCQPLNLLGLIVQELQMTLWRSRIQQRKPSGQCQESHGIAIASVANN
jgi:hypothetical protein